MKKIAFITHSFHQKTRSAHIYADEFFDKDSYLSDYFYIDDWSPDSAGPDQIIEGYDIVVIVQLMSLNILKKIKCDNIVFIPMYDFSHSWDAFKWLECVNLKILTPIKKIHDLLCGMGLNSFYFKYYPEVGEWLPGDPAAVFLWQRISTISLRTTLHLLKNFHIDRLFLHRVVDPGFEFFLPSPRIVRKYNIQLSEWFEKKEQYLDIVKKSGLYIAPRLSEGGASAFIDAMKMGKVVVAHNDAAMNEYIIHNETGLLYDAHAVRPLDPDTVDLPAIQKNAWESVSLGRRAFRDSVPNILDFIESKNKSLMSGKLYSALSHLRHEKETLIDSLENAVFNAVNIRWYTLWGLVRKERLVRIYHRLRRRFRSLVLYVQYRIG